ncbi:MAG: biotin/lipoyl-binding protein [Hyphomicrobiaceae bacterium]|nr:biotin/lipoyl-binding protein [Hyphomicrobiaceae bacterium]
MKRLKSRPRVDTLTNQQRSEPLRWGRRIYLGLIVLFACVLANYLVGGAIILRANGIVVSDRQVVAASYAGRIAAVHVRAGQSVVAGQVLVEIESADMLKDIAQLAAQHADLSQREAELRIGNDTARALLPLAERHARQVAEASEAVESVKARGLVTSKRAGEAIGSEYETAARVADLNSRTTAIAGQLPAIEEAHERARLALDQLEVTYDNGRIRAGQAGVVGSRVPVAGQVVKFGDDLMEIHGGQTTVLAYVPDQYLFAVEPGARVAVSAGLHAVTGTATGVLTVADALPPEFQNMFRPRDRSRLLRIDLPYGHPFAVSQKVMVADCNWGWCWSVLPSAHAHSVGEDATSKGEP